jgi:hypothetical protein
MAVFGIPEQHEDGALRGVRVAAEMQEAFASLMAGLLAAYTIQAMVQIRLSRDLEASARSARTPMTVDELLAHFPEVPRDLRDEPILAEYVKAFGPLLRVAQKPSPCMGTSGDAPYQFYTRLVNDLAIYSIGLAKRDRTLARLQATLDQYRRQPATFACTLVPRRAPGAPRAGCG